MKPSGSSTIKGRNWITEKGPGKCRRVSTPEENYQAYPKKRKSHAPSRAGAERILFMSGFREKGPRLRLESVPGNPGYFDYSLQGEKKKTLLLK